MQATVTAQWPGRPLSTDSDLRLLGDLKGVIDFDSQVSHRHLIEIGVTSARDPVAAEAVRNVPTSLRIDSQQVEVIRRFVRNELATNPAWQQLQNRLRSQEPALKSAGAKDAQGLDAH